MEPTAIGALLTKIGEVFTWILGKVPDVLNLFTTNTLLVLMLGLMVTGAVFGFGQRLIHRR